MTGADWSRQKLEGARSASRESARSRRQPTPKPSQKPSLVCVHAGAQDDWQSGARHAAFFDASLPVPLHSGHSSTMRSSYMGPGT